jgi:hypothetical protein
MTAKLMMPLYSFGWIVGDPDITSENRCRLVHHPLTLN